MADVMHVIRSFEPADDLPRLARLLAEVEAVDRDGDATDEDALRDQLTLPGHDPARDRWVVAASDDRETLLGWGFVWVAPGEMMATVTGAVHPSVRGQGIGDALLERAAARARALGATTVGAYAGSGNAAADAFLRRRDFLPVATNTLLRASTEPPLPHPIFPLGYTLRSYADDPDPARFLRAVNRCYEGQWGHHTVTPEFAATWMAQLDPAGILFLLAPEDDIVGIVRAERYGEPVGYIDAPGVALQHRERGLYVPLLLAAVRRLCERAPSAIELESWGDLPETLAAYEALGFAVARQAIAYERRIG